MAGILHYHVTMFEPGFPIKGFPVNLQKATLLFQSANTAGQSRFSSAIQADNGNRFSNRQFSTRNMEAFRFPLLYAKQKF